MPRAKNGSGGRRGLSKGAPNRKKGESAPSRWATLNTEFTKDRKERFLELIAATGRRASAAMEIGVSLSCVDVHLRDDPDFKAGYEHAMWLRRDQIDREIGRRGIEGVQEPVYWQGVVVGWVTRYSDTCLLAHAKAHHPDYRDRVEVDQRTRHSGGVVSARADLGKLSRKSRDLLRQILDLEKNDDGGEAPEDDV